jgi:protein-S-isoprenylcysteine O-methyltransferase Ste14
VNIITYLAFATYVAIMLSLIWARLRFFNTAATEVTIWVRLYDPIVAVQILTTFYLLYGLSESTTLTSSAWLAALIASILLFWWAILTARKLDFAFSKSVGNLLTTGPYAIIRHPFYTSYILVWASTTILFNSVFLWFTLLYLVTFYFISARDEEKVILGSEHSKEYFEYRQRVGMFLPRITKWKS